jgi:hypothetical protein
MSTRELGTLDHSALTIDGNNVEYLFANVDPIGEGFGQWYNSHPFSLFTWRCHKSIHRGAGRTIPLVVTPVAQRPAVAHLVAGHEMSARRACRVLGCCRMTAR